MDLWILLQSSFYKSGLWHALSWCQLYGEVSWTWFQLSVVTQLCKKIGERVRPCTFHLSLTGNACSFTSCFIFFLHTSLESTSLLCLCLRILADAWVVKIKIGNALRSVAILIDRAIPIFTSVNIRCLSIISLSWLFLDFFSLSSIKASDLQADLYRAQTISCICVKLVLKSDHHLHHE